MLKTRIPVTKGLPAFRTDAFVLFWSFAELLTWFPFAPVCTECVTSLHLADLSPEVRPFLSSGTGHLRACTSHSSPHPHILTLCFWHELQELSHIPLDWKHIGQVSLQGQPSTRALLSVKPLSAICLGICIATSDRSRVAHTNAYLTKPFLRLPVMQCITKFRLNINPMDFVIIQENYICSEFVCVRNISAIYFKQ